MEYNPYSGTTSSTVNQFQHNTYMVRKQMLKMFGGSFRIYDPNGALVLFASMKAFKLKEDIRLYTGEDQQHEVLIIKARSIIDFSATYDVVDSATGQAIGALRRKGLKSMIRDEWVILDAVGNEVGSIIEDSLLLALLRRFATNLIPQKYHANLGGRPVMSLEQNFNPFTFKLTVDFRSDVTGLFDRRLGLAAAVLFCAIEGREE